MTYQIQSITKTETFTNTIDYVNIYVNDVILGSSAKVITEYIRTQGGILYVTEDILTGDDYSNWGADDNYIVNWICQKYNLTLI